MAGNGLQKSSWASNTKDTSSRRVPKRRCHSCGMSNFAEGNVCFLCAHNPKILGDAAGTVNVKAGMLPTSGTKSNTWATALPQIQQRDAKISSNTPVGNGTTNTHNATVDRASGLSTSRWAPRNYAGSGNSRPAQVWTRTIHQPTPKPVPAIPALDLGLPYQVQHYILAMIQRILEEGCFDFASRWIPHALHTNHWSCPEAVELSKWRDFLPSSAPPESITPTSTNTTLSEALHHAVQIRNKAVHRHLCTNDEMRRMAVQAQDLMILLGDNTRREKFHHLYLELENWDRRSRTDEADARIELEKVLVIISERPVDEMDWTPNAVSLREVTESEVGAELPQMDDRQLFVDEMELD